MAAAAAAEESTLQHLKREMADLHEMVATDRLGGSGLHAAAHGGGLYALWTEPPLRRAALLGVLVMALNQLVGINTIMYYSASIFKDIVDVRLAVWLSSLCAVLQASAAPLTPPLARARLRPPACARPLACPPLVRPACAHLVRASPPSGA